MNRYDDNIRESVCVCVSAMKRAYNNAMVAETLSPPPHAHPIAELQR